MARSDSYRFPEPGSYVALPGASLLITDLKRAFEFDGAMLIVHPEVLSASSRLDAKPPAPSDGYHVNDFRGPMGSWPDHAFIERQLRRGGEDAVRKEELLRWSGTVWRPVNTRFAKLWPVALATGSKGEVLVGGCRRDRCNIESLNNGHPALELPGECIRRVLALSLDDPGRVWALVARCDNELAVYRWQDGKRSETELPHHGVDIGPYALTGYGLHASSGHAWVSGLSFTPQTEAGAEISYLVRVEDGTTDRQENPCTSIASVAESGRQLWIVCSDPRGRAFVRESDGDTWLDVPDSVATDVRQALHWQGSTYLLTMSELVRVRVAASHDATSDPDAPR